MNHVAQGLIQDLDSSLTPDLKAVLDTPPAALPPLERTLSAPIDTRPAPEPPVPLRARHAASAGAAPRGLQRFGTIAKSFPGADTLRVRKYDEITGLWGPIGSWPLASVKNSKDIEGWLLEFIAPKHKSGGRFQVSLFDAEGRESPGGEFVLPSPPVDNTPAHDSVALRVLDTLERKMNQQQPAPQPPPDPIATFRQVNSVLEEARARNGNGQGELATMFSAMMQLQMQQAQVQAQQQTELLKLVLAQQAQAQAMPPPPPPPAPAPVENPVMMRLMEIAMPLLVERVLKPEISTKDIISLLTSKPERNEMDALRTAVSFLREVQGSEKKESLAEEMQKMAQIKQLAAELVDNGGGGGGSSGSSFWDALGALFANKDFAGSLGKMIGSDIQQRKAQVQAPALPASTRPAGALPQQTVVHNPVPITVAQHHQPTPPLGTRTIVGDKLVIVGAEGRRIVFPANMPEMCANITEGKAPEELIQRTAAVLFALRGLENWQPFVNASFEHALKNEKAPALQALKGWLGMLVQFSLVPADTARAVLSAFDEHWASFHTALAQLMGVQPAAETQAAPAAVPAEVSAPVEASPAPSGDAEDESTEEGGDEDE